jgi:ubiquinone/menaquinone biosynthesis C-methylase UbiE
MAQKNPRKKKAASDVEDLAKRMYDRFGAEYQNTRYGKKAERAFNEYLELPAMINAVGQIRGKRLLDVGCGAGIHIRRYLKRGAICKGIDISRTMIALARKNCKDVEFQVGSASKLPYADSCFDIVTASLCIDYVTDISRVFKEINRVLVKGGLFYYSIDSPTWCMREKIEDGRYTVSGIGEFVDKKTGKRIVAGRAFKDNMIEWEMLPGMAMKTYQRTFRTQLLALVKAGFELVDFIDCKPVPAFKKRNPAKYDIFTRMPIFSIYISRKS